MSSADSYPFPPLSGLDTIRLFRLAHHEKENAPITGELFPYSLRDSNSFHLYEALSYTWGSQETPESVVVNDKVFAITENLHAALLRLRNHTLDRVVWVDAICINQKDDNEKKVQIPHIANIYRKASRVIVDVSTKNASEALEYIRLTAQGMQLTRDDIVKAIESINLLLENAYFSRTWVLQELAAARDILIVCGSVQIEAQAFCAGLKLLDISGVKNIGLRGLIPPALYLMRGAMTRPKSGWSDEKSLMLRPLGELIDMFHSHKAYKLRDRVYALLGMSTDGYNANDDDGKSRIFPDYKIPWNEVMEKVVRFTLSRTARVQAAFDQPIAGILVKGVVLGLVRLVPGEDAWSDIIKVGVDLPASILGNADIEGPLSKHMSWILPAPAKSLCEGDLVCLFEGSTNATIVRQQQDHLDILMISATNMESLYPGWANRIRSRLPLRDFVLVWDWDDTPDQTKLIADYGALPSFRSNIPKGDTQLQHDRASIALDQARILIDSDRGNDAENIVQEAKAIYDRVDGRSSSRSLAALYDLLSIYITKDRHKKFQEQVWQDIQTRIPVQDTFDPERSRSLERLASTCRDQGMRPTADGISLLRIILRDHKEGKIPQSNITAIVQEGDEHSFLLLLVECGSRAEITEKVLTSMVRSLYSDRMIAILFEERGSELKITQRIAERAAGNAYHCPETMKQLFRERGYEFEVTEDMFQSLVENAEQGSKEGLDLFEFVLGQEYCPFKLTQDMVMAAASAKFPTTDELMNLLFDKRGNEFKITNGIVDIIWGREADALMTRKRILLERSADGFDISEDMIVFLVDEESRIADGGYLALEQLFESRNADVPITMNIIMEAARNSKWTAELLYLLLTNADERGQLTAEMIKAAGEGGMTLTEDGSWLFDEIKSAKALDNFNLMQVRHNGKSIPQAVLDSENGLKAARQAGPYYSCVFPRKKQLR